MSTMDFKCVTWVGNIYQKFEAMCLEVEETMYEDTVKFVENQVQNVGSNMKKFYSDVMQDLVPPSCIDPMKVASADLALNTCADTIYKNKKANRKDEEPKSADKFISNDSKLIHGLDQDQVPSLEELHNVNHLAKSDIRGSNEGSYPKESKDGKEFEHTNKCGSKHPKNEFSHEFRKPSSKNLGLRNRNRASLVHEITPEYGANDKIVTAAEASVEVVRQDSRGKGKGGKIRYNIDSANLLINEFYVDGQIADALLPPKSKVKKGRKLQCTGESLAAKSLRTSSAADSYGNNDNALNYQSAGEEASLLDADSAVGNDGTEPMKEITTLDDKTLEESCVLVDGNNVALVSPKSSKHWSYQKKVREAFSLKKKSARSREYEKLMTQQEDANMGSKLTSSDTVTRTLPPGSSTHLHTRELCESEWELL